MGGPINIVKPELTPVQLQGQRNYELDQAAIAKVVEHFRAAYSETAAIATDFWPAQGANGVALLQRFGLWQQTILAWYGDTLPEDLRWIVTAGTELTPHQDGTVTIG
jgi:hypothetical protein